MGFALRIMQEVLIVSSTHRKLAVRNTLTTVLSVTFLPIVDVLLLMGCYTFLIGLAFCPAQIDHVFAPFAFDCRSPQSVAVDVANRIVQYEPIQVYPPKFLRWISIWPPL